MNPQIQLTVGDTIQIPEYGEVTIKQILQTTNTEGDSVDIEYNSGTDSIGSVITDSSEFYLEVIEQDGSPQTLPLTDVLQALTEH